MSKKDKKIEIQLMDSSIQLAGSTYPGYQLVIGKQVIGEIAELDDNQFAVVKQASTESVYKQLEPAVENIIEKYNLSH